MNNQKIRSAAAAAISSCVIASGAFAQSSGGSIQLETQGQSMRWDTGIDGSTNWTADGYSFMGDAFGSGWGMNWDMQASTATAQSVIANFTVMNLSSETQTFSLFITDSVATEYGMGSLVGGSIAGTFTDLNANGVNIAAVDGDSIYTAFVDATTVDPFDGSVVGNLLDDASGSAGLFQTGTFGESAFGDFPVLPGQSMGGASINYGFILEFTLSAGDTAGFTASMAIATPAPGAIALLGIAGVAGRRRRRSTD